MPGCPQYQSAWGFEKDPYCPYTQAPTSSWGPLVGQERTGFGLSHQEVPISHSPGVALAEWVAQQWLQLDEQTFPQWLTVRGRCRIQSASACHKQASKSARRQHNVCHLRGNQKYQGDDGSGAGHSNGGGG